MKELWFLMLLALPMALAAPKRSYSAIFGYDLERQTITVFWALPLFSIGTCFGIVLCYVSMHMPFWRLFGCERCAGRQESLDQVTDKLNQCRTLLDELFRMHTSLIRKTQYRKTINDLAKSCSRVRKQIQDVVNDATFQRSRYQSHQAYAGLGTVIVGTALLLAKQLHKIPKDVDWVEFLFSSISSVGAPSSSAAVVSIVAVAYPKAYMYRPFFLISVFILYFFAVGFFSDRAAGLLDTIMGVVVGIVIVDGFIHANKFRLFEESFSVLFLVSIGSAVFVSSQFGFVEVDVMAYLAILIHIYVGCACVFNSIIWLH